MKRASHSDLLIIGGGLTGLSLAYQLALRNAELSVIILEPRLRYTHDRLWSFWARKNHELTDLVYQHWDQWAYGLKGEVIERQRSKHYSYQTIRSIDFYDRVISTIEEYPNIQLRLGQIAHNIEGREGHWLVNTNDQTCSGSMIIDTRPPQREQLEASTLFQCFVGETLNQKNAFDPGVVELMTEMSVDQHGFLFSYCLPFSKDQALIEATRFSPNIVDPAILASDLARIKQHRGWLQLPIDSTEQGVLPMGLPKPKKSAGEWPKAGTAAGALRPASGYGFLRIQRWAKACSERLAQGEPAVEHPSEHRIQAWMDNLFLKVLRSEPDLAPTLFYRLYHRLQPDELVRFMTDDASLLDRVRVIRALPAWPFLRTMMT